MILKICLNHRDLTSSHKWAPSTTTSHQYISTSYLKMFYGYCPTILWCQTKYVEGVLRLDFFRVLPPRLRCPSLPYLSSSIYDLPNNISSQIRLFCWRLHNLSWTFLRYISSTTPGRFKLPLPTGLQMANAFNCSKCCSMHITHSTSLVITTYFLNGEALKWLIHTLTLVLLSYQTML